MYSLKGTNRLTGAMALVVSLLVIGSVVFLPTVLADNSGDSYQRDHQALMNQIHRMQAEIAAKGYTFKVGVNPAMLYQLNQLCGFKPELAKLPEGESGAIPSYFPDNTLTLPSSYMGVYTSIKDQGACGSCWAFSVTAEVEAAYLWSAAQNLNMSEQWVLSCNKLHYGCNGGYFDAFGMYVSTGGIPESCFPYVASKVRCSYCSNPPHYKISSWSYVGTSSSVASTTAIKNAIYTYGSVSSAVYADSYFQGYTGGVFSNTNSTSSPNHAIILCGWDDTKGAWRLKNSWGTGWGESGFMWIKYAANKVGYGACYAVK